MKQTITQSDFRDAFARMNRKENFSYEGLNALYEFLEENQEDYNLDVIALCCEFTESTLEEVRAAYNDIESFDALADHTTVIPVNDTAVIYQQF